MPVAATPVNLPALAEWVDRVGLGEGRSRISAAAREARKRYSGHHPGCRAAGEAVAPRTAVGTGRDRVAAPQRGPGR